MIFFWFGVATLLVVLFVIDSALGEADGEFIDRCDEEDDT